MSNFHINHSAPRGEGRSSHSSPTVLMFEQFVCNLRATVEEEIWFDDSDWPDGFDWRVNAGAVWEGLAEDAAQLSTFPPRNPSARLLCRGAGVIACLLRVQDPADLTRLLRRYEALMKVPASLEAKNLMRKALAHLKDVLALKQQNGPDGGETGPALPLAS